MANDYISRNEVLADIRATIESSGCVNHEREIIDCVRYATAADVVPVVRATWSRESTLTNYGCTNCGFRDWDRWRYCPSCGARMTNTEMEAPQC